MSRRKIIITAEDCRRLEALVASHVARAVSGTDRLESLQAELNGAKIVTRNKLPADVVTMESTVTLRDLDADETESYTLVYPDRADIANGKLSVLAPIGTAILGYRVGDELRWQVPAGWRRLRIEHVEHAPEAEQACPA